MGAKRWIGAALGAAMIASTAVVATVAPAGADVVLLSCNAGPQTATLNPPLGSGDSKYYKSVAKSPGGATCDANLGIAFDNPLTDSSKPNPFDNQTNSFTTLHVVSSTSITSGSFTCNTVDPANEIAYPQTYPGQGKLVTKFAETNALGKQLQLQAYIRLGKDLADPDPYDLVISGIVIKGVGVGGSVHAVVTLFPDVLSTKNLNLADCAANPAVGNASLSVMTVTPADGSDADAAVDPWTVSIPS